MLNKKELSIHTLEKALDDCTRAVEIRRQWVSQKVQEAGVQTDSAHSLDGLPLASFNSEEFYRSTLGTNCEGVIGYATELHRPRPVSHFCRTLTVPVGIIGPLQVDNQDYFVPMATTEGALIASTNRGCRAIRDSGGLIASVMSNGMTRAPVVRMSNVKEASRMKQWVDNPENFQQLKAAFESTTNFGKLQSVEATVAHRYVYLRFRATTGDAMGMNMISKGVEKAMDVLGSEFDDMKLLSLSGNMCTDKKPSAINWIQGRGKSVTCEARITADVLKRVLKVDNVRDLVELNTAKNLVGSAMAGSIGGFNAHAANIVTAVFLATGQDCAQNVESSTCLTFMEQDGEDLIMTCTMPSIEVGTVGGGTTLPAQAACLDLLGLKGADRQNPGNHSETLARIVCSSVMAGELSLMSALVTNTLVSSHIQLNRKDDAKPIAASTTATAHAQAPKKAQNAAGAFELQRTSAQSPGRRHFAAACGTTVPAKWMM